MLAALRNSMREIIPTVVPEKVGDVPATLARYPFAEVLHIDLADGTLAPNTTWLPQTKGDLPKARYEAHLMVRDPLSLGIACARAGIRRLIAHIESFPHAERAGEIFTLWRSAGAEEIGCAVNLLTPLSMCDSYATLVDCMHVMTIEHIGEQGQPFDERALARVREVHARHPELVVAVDGGITEENIAELARAGATRFCIGSALARAKDPASTYQELLRAVNAVS